MAKRTTHTLTRGLMSSRSDTIRIKEWSAEVHPGNEKRKGDDDDYFTNDQDDAPGKIILKQLAKESGHGDSSLNVKVHGMKKEEIEEPFRVHRR